MTAHFLFGLGVGLAIGVVLTYFGILWWLARKAAEHRRAALAKASDWLAEF